MRTYLKRNKLSVTILGVIAIVALRSDSIEQDSQPAMPEFSEVSVNALPNSSTALNLQNDLTSFGRIALYPAQEHSLGSLSNLGNSVIAYRAPRTVTQSQKDQFVYNIYR